jgi:hypothetical protein
MNSTPLHAFVDHVVDCVAAAAADADHLDDCFLRLCLDQLKHVYLLCRWLLDRVAATLGLLEIPG